MWTKFYGKINKDGKLGIVDIFDVNGFLGLRVNVVKNITPVFFK